MLFSYEDTLSNGQVSERTCATPALIEQLFLNSRNPFHNLFDDQNHCLPMPAEAKGIEWIEMVYDGTASFLKEQWNDFICSKLESGNDVEKYFAATLLQKDIYPIMLKRLIDFANRRKKSDSLLQDNEYPFSEESECHGLGGQDFTRTARSLSANGYGSTLSDASQEYQPSLENLISKGARANLLKMYDSSDNVHKKVPRSKPPRQLIGSLLGVNLRTSVSQEEQQSKLLSDVSRYFYNHTITKDGLEDFLIKVAKNLTDRKKFEFLKDIFTKYKDDLQGVKEVILTCKVDSSVDRRTGVRLVDDSPNLLDELKKHLRGQDKTEIEEEHMSYDHESGLRTVSKPSGRGNRKNLITDEDAFLKKPSVSFSSGGVRAKNTTRTPIQDVWNPPNNDLQNLIISSRNTVAETDKKNSRDQNSSYEYEEETNLDGDNELILEDEELYDIGSSVKISSGGGNHLKATRTVSFSDNLLPNPRDQNSSGVDDVDEDDEKDKLILSLRKELAQSQKKTAQLEEAYQVHSCQAERIQRKLERSLDEKDSIIETMKSSLAEKDETISNIRSSYENFDEEIQTLITSLAERESEMETLGSSLTEKDSEMDTLRLSLTEKDSEMDTLKSSMEGMRSQWVAIVEDRNEQLNTMKKDAKAMFQEMNSLREYIDRLEQRVKFVTEANELDENVNDSNDEDDEGDRVKVVDGDVFKVGDKVTLIDSDESGEGIVAEISVNRQGFPRVLVQFGENNSDYYHPKELKRVDSVDSVDNDVGNVDSEKLA